MRIKVNGCLVLQLRQTPNQKHQVPSTKSSIDKTVFNRRYLIGGYGFEVFQQLLHPAIISV